MAFKFYAKGKPWFLIVAFLVIATIAALIVSNTIKGGGGSNEQGRLADLGSSNAKGIQRRVTYNGVSFSYSSLLASEVKAQTVREQRLENADEKPDNVTPRHLAFTLEGSYPAEHLSSFFAPPEIHVYSISEYKKVLAASKLYVEGLDQDVEALKRILRDKPSHVDTTIPVLPWLDAVQAFRAHVKYVEFRNGKGILFLTQYNIEPSIINNDGLAYIFQGLTDDGQYYISATFPVSAPNLPKSFDAETFEGYTIPENFYKDYESNKKVYQEYLARIERKLNDLPAEEYQPKLQLFEELIGSLKIDSSS
jgi:hypothetical protein